MTRGGAVAAGGRGRGTMKGQSRRDLPVSQNGSQKQATGDIEILHTDTLIKEVCRIKYDFIPSMELFVFHPLGK